MLVKRQPWPGRGVGGRAGRHRTQIEDRRIVANYHVLNPDKLSEVRPPSATVTLSPTTG
jgi:hypothetical protein